MKNTTNLLNYNAKPYLQTYRKIREKLYGVHLYWEIFKQLYAGNRTRFAIINEAALEYFYYSQDVYLAYVESGLMRLADPSETCGKRNMSIQRLVEEVENFEQCPAISLELRKMLRKFEEQIIELKDRRNKTRAHNDYEVALGKVRVSSISRKHVNDALRVLKKLMSEIESHIGQKGLDECASIEARNSVNRLFQCLEDGLEYRELLEKSHSWSIEKIGSRVKTIIHPR